MEKPGSILDRLQEWNASLLGNTFSPDESYIQLSKILLASAHCASAEGILTLNAAVEPVVETKNLLLGEGTEDLGIGVPLPPSIKDPTCLKDLKNKPAEDPTCLKDLKNKPAGSLPSLLFWTPGQSNFLSNGPKRQVLHGTFGAGKTILLIEKMNRLIQTAVKYNDAHPDQQKEIRGMFISCLDPEAEGDFVPPIYDILMEKYCDENEKLKNKKVTVNFFNAFDICEKMGVDCTLENFYSQLPAFIEKGNKYPSFM